MTDLRLSVYARGILFMALVCLALLGLDFRQTWEAHDARLLVAKTETDNLARSLAQHAQDVFETTEALLKGLSDAIAADGRDAASIMRLERRMRVSVANHQLLHGLFLFDEEGNWIASSLGAADFARVRDLNYAERDFFRFHRDHDAAVTLVGPPIRARSTARGSSLCRAA